MSTVKLCDRCGARITLAPQPLSYTRDTKERIVIQFTTDFVADLCAFCMDSLKEWMATGQQQSK